MLYLSKETLSNHNRHVSRPLFLRKGLGPVSPEVELRSGSYLTYSVQAGGWSPTPPNLGSRGGFRV